MREGLSTNRLCEAQGEALAASGKSFVFRYYSRTTQQAEKRLRPREAAMLARAGLDIGVVYQDFGRRPEDFGAARGALDAAGAFASAGQIGQPAGSAIYFAVDVDFSSAEVRAVVLPYFEAVRRTLADAAGGGPGYRVGVYGSGLTCRLVRDAGLADFAWLAEASGWRESATYDGWDVRQFVNRGETLAALGSAWERCVARGEFGGFRPAGFEYGAGEGEVRRVTAAELNLRWVPTAKNNEPITRLPQGTRVWVLGESAPGWVRVRTVLQGATFIGHVNASHLAPVESTPPALPVATPPAPAAPAAPLPIVPAVHFRENNPASARQSTGSLASPIGEPGRPGRDAAGDAPARVRQLEAIADWLAVDASARYQPRDGVTFCNVYAADYCYLAGVYLPRCWWTGAAVARLAAGQAVSPLYGDTIREMRADDLYQGLQDCGAAFGWRRVGDPTALQAAANAGGVGVICADRREAGRPGHISVVVPETASQRAERDADGNVLQPLQSQAGGRCWRYGSAGRDWWRGAQFVDHVFFVHD